MLLYFVYKYIILCIYVHDCYVHRYVQIYVYFFILSTLLKVKRCGEMARMRGTVRGNWFAHAQCGNHSGRNPEVSLVLRSGSLLVNVLNLHLKSGDDSVSSGRIILLLSVYIFVNVLLLVITVCAEFCPALIISIIRTGQNVTHYVL